MDKAWRLVISLAITISFSFAAGAILKKTYYLVQPFLDRL